jgi:FkbM family methyltransferase
VKSDGDPSRVFESGERQILLNELLKINDPLILDIGANIGVFALFFAHAGYRVHAFEPLRKNYQLLQCSILANQFNQSQLTLNTFGLSSQKEPFCLSMPGPNQGGTFVNGKNCSQEDLASFERLDTYLETHLKGEVPYMIKIDTEGHEYLALFPAKEYFRKYGTPKYILSEFGAEFLKRAGTDPDDYLKFFWDLGMTVMHRGKEVEKGNEEYRYLLEPSHLSNIHVIPKGITDGESLF